MSYKIVFTIEADKTLAKYKKSNPNAFKKSLMAGFVIPPKPECIQEVLKAASRTDGTPKNRDRTSGTSCIRKFCDLFKENKWKRPNCL